MSSAIREPKQSIHIESAKYCSISGKFFAQVGTFYPLVLIIFLLFSELSDFHVEKWLLNGDLPTVTAYPAVESDTVCGMIMRPAGRKALESRGLFAIVCNQIARHSGRAQPFSDFDVQSNRSPDTQEVRIPAESLTPDGVLGSA